MKKSIWISTCCVLIMAGAILLYSLLPQPRPPYTGPITPAAFSNNEAILDGFGYKDFDSKAMLSTYGELVETKEHSRESYPDGDNFATVLYFLKADTQFVGYHNVKREALPPPETFHGFYATNKKAVFYRDIRIGDKLEDVLKKFPHEERQTEPWGNVTVQPIYGEATHMGQYAHIALKNGKPEVLFLADTGHLLCLLLDEQENVAAVGYWAEGYTAVIKRGSSNNTIY